MQPRGTVLRRRRRFSEARNESGQTSEAIYRVPISQAGFTIDAAPPGDLREELVGWTTPDVALLVAYRRVAALYSRRPCQLGTSY